MGGEERKHLHHARTSLIKTVEIPTGNHTGENFKVCISELP